MSGVNWGLVNERAFETGFAQGRAIVDDVRKQRAENLTAQALQQISANPNATPGVLNDLFKLDSRSAIGVLDFQQKRQALDRDNRFRDATARYYSSNDPSSPMPPSVGVLSAAPGMAPNGVGSLGMQDGPPPISAAPAPPADWKARIGTDGVASAALAVPPMDDAPAASPQMAPAPASSIVPVDPNTVGPYTSQGGGATGQPAPQAPAEIPQHIARLATSPNMDDRNTAFAEMVKIDAPRAFKIQSDARDQALDTLKDADEAFRLAAARLANTRDDAGYKAVLADLQRRIAPLGVDLSQWVPLTHPGPEGIKQLRLQALDAADQFQALDREARTSADVANIQTDNERLDREADDRINDRRERRGLAERRENRLAAGRGGGGVKKGGPTVLKNGTVIKGRKDGKSYVYYNGKLQPLGVSQ